MGDRIRKWIAVLLAGSILAMIQLVPAGGAVFVRGNIENKEILGEKETSLQQTLHARAWVLMDADSGRILAGKDADTAYPMASTTKILTCILALEQEIPMTGSRYQRKRPPCRMSSSICGRGSGTAYRIYSIP
ncbi:MAG: hypothetical protein ACLVAO_08660 [Clostridium fessum]